MKANKYVIKALDAYPYNLEEAAESLEYALSYNNEDTTALCLMGRMHSEILKDYEAAKNYYLEALAVNVYALEVYPYYINTLILNEDFEAAEKFIDFALGVKGADKAWIWFRKAGLFEIKQQYKKALKFVEKARLLCNNTCFATTLQEIEDRINAKINKKKEKKKKDKKA